MLLMEKNFALFQKQTFTNYSIHSTFRGERNKNFLPPFTDQDQRCQVLEPHAQPSVPNSGLSRTHVPLWS